MVTVGTFNDVSAACSCQTINNTESVCVGCCKSVNNNIWFLVISHFSIHFSIVHALIIKISEIFTYFFFSKKKKKRCI